MPENQPAMDPEIEQKAVAFTNYCLQQMIGGVNHDALKQDLVARGISSGLADMFISQAAEILTKRLADWHSAATNQSAPQQPPTLPTATMRASLPSAQAENAKKEAAKLQMLIGGIALGLGGLVTLASYGMSEPGGKYLLAYGAIIVGGWNVVSGFFKYASA